MSGGNCPGGTCPGGLCPRTVKRLSLVPVISLVPAPISANSDKPSLGRRLSRYHLH